MPEKIGGQILYTPSETAQKLGISLDMLRYLRRNGRIKGSDYGNTTLYTEEQIQAADLSRKKRGPKQRPEANDDGLKSVA